MANRMNAKQASELQARAVTYNVLCGIVKNFGEATLPEIRAKYKKVARPWDLPFSFVSEESARAYLNQGVKNGLMRYERRVKGRISRRRLNGMSEGAGYYIWIETEE